MSQPQGTSRQSRGRTRQTGCTSYTLLVLSFFIPESRNVKMPSTLMGGGPQRHAHRSAITLAPNPLTLGQHFRVSAQRVELQVVGRNKLPVVGV